MSRTRGMQAFCTCAFACGAFLVGEVLAHTQLGSNIGFTGSLSPISLSGDGQRLAVGGQKVFDWSGSNWQQLGADIVVNSAGATLSVDGRRIAIIEAVQHQSGWRGSAKVFEWSGSAWQQLGNTIEGTIEQDGWELRTSSSLSLSADGNRLALSTRSFDSNGNISVFVQTRVFEWSGAAWLQLGAAVDIGMQAESTASLSLSGSGGRLAVGNIWGEHQVGVHTGRLQVFEWSGSVWQQLGATLYGDRYFDQFGRQVDLSTDGQRVAVLSTIPAPAGEIFPAGEAQVFEWTGSSWQQLGAPVLSVRNPWVPSSDYYEWFSVSLDAMGTRMALGATAYGSAAWLGDVSIFELMNGTWRKLGADLRGSWGGKFGDSVSLSADGSRVAATGTYHPAGVWAVDTQPALTLAGLEVVQVVQDWENNAQLVAGKKTVIRAHLEDPIGPTPITVHSRFRIFGYGGAGLNEPLVPPFIDNGPHGGGEALILPVAADPVVRSDKSRSATFYLKDGWLSAGPKRFVFSSQSIPIGTCKDQAGPTHDDCSVTVDFKARKPMVLHLIPTRFRDFAGTKYETTSDDLMAACSQIERRFPAHPVVCVVESNPIEFSRPATATFPSTDQILGRTEMRKWLYGGCWWDSCKDFYLAVTAFQACKNSGCSQPNVVGQANFPNFYDITSRTAWTVNESIDPLAPPHEIGHTVDLEHTALTDDDPYPKGTCGEEANKGVRYPPSNTFPFPYYSGDDPLLGPMGNDQLLVFGYDSKSDLVIAHTENAMMSYCDQLRTDTKTSWPDIGSYNKVFEDFAIAEAPVARTLEANDAEFYYVNGSIDLEAGAAELDPVELLVPPVVPPSPPQSGDWTLIVHHSGAADAVIPLHLKVSPNDPSQARFAAFVEYGSDIMGFTVQREGVTQTQLTASDHAPVITITAPAPGSQFLSEEVVLEWSASDADGDELVFLIDYSADGGISWVNISAPWPSSPFSVFSSSIQPSQNALFRVTALDGFHSTTALLPGAVVVNAGGPIFQDGFE